MRKRILVTVIAAIIAVLGIFGLGACDGGDKAEEGNKLAPATNFTFDTNTGAYSFDGVDNCEAYNLIVVKYDNKGVECKDTVALVGMVRGTGKITGTIQFQKFSFDTTKPGGIIPVSELPKATYGIKCVSVATNGSGYTNSDPYIHKFTLGGKLECPKTVYTVKDGKLNVDLACFYAEECLWYNGLPSKIEVYVKNKTTGENITTLTFDDFSYNNAMLACYLFYLFDNIHQEFTLPSGVTAADLEITAKAFGNGNTTTDSIEVPAQEHEPFKRITDESVFWLGTKPIPADWNSFWAEYDKN